MKKWILALLALCLFILTGCGGKTAEPSPAASSAAKAKTEASDVKKVSANAAQQTKENAPTVYFTKDISPDGLLKVYNALNAVPTGKIGVKISTGEPPKSNYLRPELIAPLVKKLNASIVECNTAYGGARSNAGSHLQVAKEHGFTAIAPVDIQDAEGEISLPVKGGQVLKENFVGSHFANYDYYVVLSHFKGHAMAGLGGAVKNASIGFASASGKRHLHSGGGQAGTRSGGDLFLAAMAEATKSVADKMQGSILYINVMNRLSVDCDCDGNPAKPDMHDIGVLASFDPVALDQACVDLVYAVPDGKSLIERMEFRNGLYTLEHAAKIGLGSRQYKLAKLD